ncbi:MAG: ABC transporter ATP-binding protein/permease [Coriobacteriia bacterium]|nr:ABC transporter ATP-binding protein/permease [Coriobacteriia bacterium]
MLRKYIEKLKEVSRYNAVKRLFAFVEVKRSEVMGLVAFVLVATLLEGFGLTLLLPILQYAEGGQSALQDSGGFYWQFLADILAFVNLEPTLVVLLLLAFGSVVLRNVSLYFRVWYGAVVSSRIMLRLRMKVVDMVYSADPEFYTRHPVGQLVGVVMGQTGSAGNAVLAVINLIGTILLMVMYVAILLFLSWELTLVALFFALLVTLVNRRVLKWIANNALRNARLSQKLMGKITERMAQMQLVKLRFTKDEESENIRETSEVMRGLGIRASRVGASVEVMVDPLQMLSVFITLYIGIAFLGSTLAQLALLLFILVRLNAKVKEFNDAIRGITAAAAGVKLTREMFDAAAESNTIKSGAKVFNKLEQGISLKGVSFDYPDVYNAQGELISRGKSVLKGVTAEVPVGSFTALVGRSGAGKSTLVELFPRMRDVSGGSISYDEVNVKDFDIKSLRRSIGYVTQMPMLFNDTVYDNITYGLGFEPTEEQVREAMEAAHATFVYDLPHGLDTLLGDRGVRFSGGERQRIALARVLLEDNEILVFDEPTSSLDSESEGYIQQTLAALHGKKTLIVVAHRLSTIVAADQLLVVDDGKIVESGSHQELMDKQGTYARLFESQMIEVIDE